jgi:hypothetical protein
MSIRAAVIMVLTFVFGIVPATALALLAAVLGAAGVGGLFGARPGGALEALAFIATAILALYGYVALFFAAGDAVTPSVAQWLCAGIVADVIAMGPLAGPLRWLAPFDWLLLGAPLIVGCAHLARYAARAKRCPERES